MINTSVVVAAECTAVSGRKYARFGANNVSSVPSLIILLRAAEAPDLSRGQFPALASWIKTTTVTRSTVRVVVGGSQGHEVQQTLDSNYSGEDVLPLHTVKSGKTIAPYLCTLQLNGVKTQMEIDTGAASKLLY